MSINSMTGHGRGESALKGAKVVVEINSVNHRQFDLRLDMPPAFLFIEQHARGIIHESLSRGSIFCRIHFQPGGEMSVRHVIIDENMLGQLVRLANKTERSHAVKNDLSFGALLGVQGFIKVIPAAGNDVVLKTMTMAALRKALDSISRMRAAEGRHLAMKIRARLKHLDSLRKAIGRHSPIARRRHGDKLYKLLASAAEKMPLDKKNLREAVMAAERGDISEELERSQVHLLQFAKMMASTEPVGRAMDFLVQEMMREINTIGSKSNDCATSGLVIEYKAELESIREQVQNIE